jgi:DNA-binding XRE family transcriptional regulator
MSNPTMTSPSWRDNPALVNCYDRFRHELQAIKNNEPYNPVEQDINSITNRRKRLGLTQLELSQFAGVAAYSVSRAERRLYNPGYRVIYMIEDALTRLENDLLLTELAAN